MHLGDGTYCALLEILRSFKAFTQLKKNVPQFDLALIIATN